MNPNISFITNEENQSLKERFRTLIKDSSFFDCLVGYFYSSGFYAIYPALDPDCPATLSHDILTELLRKSMDFQGLIITDDLEMGAIEKNMGVARGATAAFEAGADILLICQDQKMWTLMVWLYQLQMRSGQGVIYASLIIAGIPTLLIFVFAQNIIMRGIVVPVEK